MFQKLQSIRNPIQRASLGAGAGFSIAVVLAVVIMGAVGVRGKGFYRLGLVAAAIGALAGGVSGAMLQPSVEDLTSEKAEHSFSNSQEPVHSFPDPQEDTQVMEYGDVTLVTGVEIVFAKSKKTFLWDGTYNNILELAEANKIFLPFSCREGVCLTCMTALLEGRVSYPSTQDSELAGHYATYAKMKKKALICSARPNSSKIILDA